MQTIKLIPLGNISIIGNYRDVAPPKETDPDIIELSNSIAKDGVMQAILVRPDAKKKEHYQVIFGHRRLLASKVAKQVNIPASIKEVADDDILELQVTENMNRKDVHPMDEAVAYSTLMKKKKYSVQEIADRFGKKADYITQRLKLNDLIPDLQKDFKQDHMLLGHALLLCKLTPDDQKEAKKQANDRDFRNESVAAIKDWIEEDIMQDLSKVPWNLDDKTILPAAGACSACPKRSGAGNLLFTDMAKDNRCFDSKCFDQKKNTFFAQQLKEVIETKPEVYLICNRYDDIPMEVNKLVQKMKVKILKGHDAYVTYPHHSSYAVKAKGFHVGDGYDQGKTVDIYLKGKATKAGSPDSVNGAASSKAIIAGIQERTKRAAELDGEKVYVRILDAIKDHPTQKAIDDKMKTIPPVEDVAMLMIVLNYADFAAKREIEKKLKLSDNAEKLYKQLEQLSNGEITWMIRRSFFSRHRGNYPKHNEALVIRKMAESYKDIPIKTFEAEQKEVRDRREERAKARIAALAPKKKVATKALVKKKAAKKK